MYLPHALDRAWKCIGCMEINGLQLAGVGLPRQEGGAPRETVSGLCNGRNFSVLLSFHFHKRGPIRPQPSVRGGPQSMNNKRTGPEGPSEND